MGSTFGVPITDQRLRVLPVEFKLLWTSQERITIKAMRATDPVIDDFFDIIDDPSLPHVVLNLPSTQQAVDYMLGKLLTAGILTELDVSIRREAILAGQFA